MHIDKSVEEFLRIVLAVSRLVNERTGIDPLLSRSIYTYAVEDPGSGWLETGRSIEMLSNSLHSLPQDQSEFIADLLQAMHVMVREGQGEKISYSKRVQAYLQVSGEPLAEIIIDKLRQELFAELVLAGYPDDLQVAYQKWSLDQTIKDAELLETGRALLAESRIRTNERVMQDPSKHRIELNFPKTYPYNGYSDYSKDFSGRVYLNGDVSYRLSSLKHLICHEALPGHQLFSALREFRFQQGLLPVEGTVYLANTPITPIVEGTCEIGQRMLGMDDTQNDKIEDLYNRYSSAVSTNIAVACNTDSMDQATAADRLMELIFIDKEHAIRHHAFMTNPLWQTSFMHYWHGREMMRQNFARMKDHLPELYQMVYTEPHTVRTLRSRIERYLET